MLKSEKLKKAVAVSEEEKSRERSPRRADFPAAIFLAGNCPNLGRDSMWCCQIIGEELSSSVEMCRTPLPARNLDSHGLLEFSGQGPLDRPAPKRGIFPIVSFVSLPSSRPTMNTGNETPERVPVWETLDQKSCRTKVPRILGMFDPNFAPNSWLRVLSGLAVLCSWETDNTENSPRILAIFQC